MVQIKQLRKLCDILLCGLSLTIEKSCYGDFFASQRLSNLLERELLGLLSLEQRDRLRWEIWNE